MTHQVGVRIVPIKPLRVFFSYPFHFDLIPMLMDNLREMGYVAATWGPSMARIRLRI